MIGMVPVATGGIITIYVSAVAIIAVTMPTRRIVVTAMSAPIIGIVGKDRNSEEE